MKLHTRFLQLPIQFDADVLAREIAGVGENEWKAHPAGYAGNDFLPLISANGDPEDEAFDGPMRPTPLLSAARPYLIEVLGALGATLGRTRLMRLSGKAEVTEHVDVNYYWRDRMRVHVPIVTQPTVIFHCGDASVHMAAGECWVFDTWSLHRVINDETRARVHLVIDTVGGEGMYRLLTGGRAPRLQSPSAWAARKIAPSGVQPKLDFETVNTPTVMSPWEMREHLNFILGDALPNQPAGAHVARLASPFLHKWRGLWAAFGEDAAGFPRYRALFNQFIAELRAAGAGDLMLVNELDFLSAFQGMVAPVAIADAPRGKAMGEQRTAPTARA